MVNYKNHVLFHIQAEEKCQHEPMVIADMPHMAQFVFDLYNQKIDRLMVLQKLPRVNHLVHLTRTFAYYKVIRTLILMYFGGKPWI